MTELQEVDQSDGGVGNGDTIRIGQGIQCLLYAGFCIKKPI